MTNKYMTIKELKERYHMGNDKISKLVHMPKFPTLKIGGRYYIDKEKLLKLEEIAIEKKCDLFQVVA